MLGRFSRFGFGRQIALSIFLLILLQLMDNTVADFARQSEDLWPLVYLPPLTGILIAMLLLWLSNDPLQRQLARKSANVGGATP